jgi:hypothetical protein
VTKVRTSGRNDVRRRPLHRHRYLRRSRAERPRLLGHHMTKRNVETALTTRESGTQISVLTALVVLLWTMQGCGGGSDGTGKGGSAGGNTSGNNGGGGSSTSNRDGSVDAAVGDGSDSAAISYILGPVTDNQTPILVSVGHLSSYTALGLSTQVLSDDKGDIFFLNSRLIEKRGPNFDLIWSADLSQLDPRTVGSNGSITESLSVASDGSVAFGGDGDGLAPEIRRPQDAFVVKLNLDGTLAWIKNAGLTNGTRVITEATVTISGGATVVGGLTPAPWLSRFEADGSQKWLKFYQAFADPAGSSPWPGTNIPLLEDAAGNIELVTDFGILKVDSAGTELLRVDARAKKPSDNTFISFLPVALTSTKGAFYSRGSYHLSAYALAPSVAPSDDIALGLFDLNLVQQWARPDEPERLDTPPNRASITDYTWKGDFHDPGQSWLGLTQLAASSDAVYLMGDYHNDTKINGMYNNYFPIYVGRYDLQGNRVWFQEFVPDESGLTSASLISSQRRLFVAPDGNPIVFMTSSKGTYIFRLNANDGTLL